MSQRAGPPSAPKKPVRKRAAARAPNNVDPAFAAVVASFENDRTVALGRMFSSESVLNVNGKIFAMFVRGRFVAKLPKARVDALVSSGRAKPFEPGQGRLMKEWVELEGDRPTWVALAREARRFVKGGDR